MSDLSQLIFLAGLGSSLILGVLLAVSRYAPSVAIWPCPDHRSWQALTFWSLFRIANVSTIATLAVSCAPGLLESSPRLIALVLGALSFACYFAACLELGHKNLYGGTAGLRTQGIYRWSRNPQYATAIPGYIAFAIAAHSAPALALAVLLSMAFWLMAMQEEAWLERAYGEAYVRYRSRVPRFFNFSRLWITMQHAATFARRRVERLNLHNSTG